MRVGALEATVESCFDDEEFEACEVWVFDWIDDSAGGGGGAGAGVRVAG